MEYRSEIDGLRALAVLPVILFHAGFKSFSGGFVGVDVFFVISGYLITTIIISEMIERKFSVINFYERRARRILPALFFMMGMCIPFAWMWLSPEDLDNFGKSLIAVSTFSSNILFWIESGYFETASELKPLLHTWSLAVEEQFYIFFPLFVVLIWKLKTKNVLLILAMLFLISLITSHIATNFASHPKIISGSFFLLPTRAWELIIGVILAFYLKYNNHMNSRLFNEVFSLIGLSMIIFSIFLFDENTPFPSFYALIPTIGTGLLILCAVKNTLMNRLLSLKIFVGIGLISYSAYLWHQPLLAFARHFSIYDISNLNLLFLCIASFLIAWFSWQYIEQPFRNKDIYNKKQIFALSISTITFFVIIGSFFHFNNGYENRISKELRSDYLKKEAKSCNFQFEFAYDADELFRCLEVADIFLVGDSHAQSLSFSLNEKMEIEGKKLITLTHNSCLPIKGVSRNKIQNSCKELKELLYERIYKNKNNVVLSARWRLNINGDRYNNMEGGVEKGISGQIFVEDPNNKKDLMSYLVDNLKEISDKTNLVIVNQIPEVGIHVPKWYIRNNEQYTHSYEEYDRQNNSVNNIFNSIEKIGLIETDKLVCEKISGRCNTRFESNLLYFDDDHPSVFFADKIATEISEIYIAKNTVR